MNLCQICKIVLIGGWLQEADEKTLLDYTVAFAEYANEHAH
jgi:hypothetical protein